MGIRSICVFGLALGLWLVTGGASAHGGAMRYVDVEATEAGATTRVRVDRSSAAMAVGVDPSADSASFMQRAELLRALVIRGIEVRAGDVPCRAEQGMLEVEAERVMLTVDWACGAGERDIVDNSADDGHQTMVTLQGTAAVLRSQGDKVPFSAPETLVAVTGRFAWQGALHLVTGYDHLLFLFSLMLAAGLVAREHGRKKALREVALIVSAFTVGHSITLVLASLGVVSLPGALVESAIAASIIAVAVLNIARPDRALGRPQIALAFGLVHGFGFSSVLAEVGLPPAERAVALFAFNVGIELAQLAVVAVLLVPLAWLARRRLYRVAVMQVGSAGIALLAARWLVERALGV